MSSKKKRSNHTYRSTRMNLKLPRLRSANDWGCQKYQDPSDEREHKVPKTITSEVDEVIAVDETANNEELHEILPIQSLSNELEVKGILVETTIKKEGTLNSDQPIRRPENVVKASRGRDFRNHTQLNINKNYLTFLLLATIVSSISVTGLLRSTEISNPSELQTRTIPPPLSKPPPPPQEPRVEIDVYTDNECVKKLVVAKWGEIEAGRIKNRDIYIKNAGNSDVTLRLLTENWDPTEASKHITLSWDYDGENLRSGAVSKITLTLNADAYAPLLEEFIFDIVIVGSAM